jgi:hypothetical protein
MLVTISPRLSLGTLDQMVGGIRPKAHGAVQASWHLDIWAARSLAPIRMA